MTTEDWFAAISPGPLINSVIEDHDIAGLSIQAASRRFRLFSCAVVRQVWDLLSTDSRSAVQTSERYAERRATRTDLIATALEQQNGPVTASQLARAAAQAASGPEENYPRMIRFSDSRQRRLDGLFNVETNAARAVATRDVGPAPSGRPTTPEWHAAWTAAFNAARALQADYFRDIFPPPGYTPQRDPSWITSTVFALARQMDETGDFSTVPILADALQDAGCEDQTILNCCRTSVHTHVRGNWVVDLVLERT